MNTKVVSMWFVVAALTLAMAGMTTVVSEQVAHASIEKHSQCQALNENAPGFARGVEKAKSATGCNNS